MENERKLVIAVGEQSSLGGGWGGHDESDRMFNPKYFQMLKFFPFFSKD